MKTMQEILDLCLDEYKSIGCVLMCTCITNAKRDHKITIEEARYASDEIYKYMAHLSKTSVDKLVFTNLSTCLRIAMIDFGKTHRLKIYGNWEGRPMS